MVDQSLNAASGMLVKLKIDEVVEGVVAASYRQGRSVEDEDITAGSKVIGGGKEVVQEEGMAEPNETASRKVLVWYEHACRG